MSKHIIFLLLGALFSISYSLSAQEVTDTYFTQTIERFADQELIRPEHRKEFVSLAQNIDQETWTQIDCRDMDQKLENPEWTDNERLIWKGIYIYYYYLMTMFYKGLEIYQSENIDKTTATREAWSFFRAICFIAYYNEENLEKYMKGESSFSPRISRMLPSFSDIVIQMGPERAFNYYFPALDFYSSLAKTKAIQTLSTSQIFFITSLKVIEEKFPDSFIIKTYQASIDNLASNRASYKKALALKPNTPIVVFLIVAYGDDNRTFLEKLISELPFVLILYEKLALSYLNSENNIQKAEKILNEALNHIESDTHPRNIQGIYEVKAYLYSAYLDKNDRDGDKAEKYIDKIRQLAPDYIGTYRMVQQLWLNIVKNNQRRNNKALADMKKLLELCEQYDVPVQAEDYRYTAKFYMNMQEYKKAYPLLVKSIKAKGIGITLPKTKLKRDFNNILKNYWPLGGPGKEVEAFLHSIN